MSGGAYNYAFGHVDTMAGQLEGVHTNTLRKAFQKHLYQVARVMKAVEWADSFDISQDEADEAIRALLGPGAEIEAATEIAERALAQLEYALTRATHNATVSRVGDEG